MPEISKTPRPVSLADLSGLRILVCNDDGIHAAGLKALEKIAQGLSPDVWVVAPERNQSGVAHSITMQRPLRIRELSPRRFAVDGTPADCVALALEQVLDGPPALLLSGINEGSNAGDDVTYSGTLGVAMEGTFHGIPSVALSLDRENRKMSPRWNTVEHFAPSIIRKLMSVTWDPRTFVSINFPDVSIDQVAGVRVAVQGHHNPGTHVHPVHDHWGDPCYWVGSVNRQPLLEEHTDLGLLARNFVAVTPLTMNLTHRSGLETLAPLFENGF